MIRRFALTLLKISLSGCAARNIARDPKNMAPFTAARRFILGSPYTYIERRGLGAPIQCGGLILVASLLSLASSVAAADEPPDTVLPPVIVQYGLSPDQDNKDAAIENAAPSLDQYGLVGNLLAGWAHRAVAKETYRNTMATLDAVDRVDLDALIGEHWPCFGAAEGLRDCRRLLILGPNGVVGDSNSVDPATNSRAIAVSVAFTSEMMRGAIQNVGANVRVYLLESDGENYEISDQFVFWYVASPPEGIKHTPFYTNPTKVSSNEAKKRASAREYWFANDAEALEQLVIDFGTHFPSLLDEIYSSIITSEGRLDFKEWYKSLQPVTEVFDKKTSKCIRDICKYRIVSLDNSDGRHWLVKPFGRVPVIRAIPCNWFGCATPVSREER